MYFRKHLQIFSDDDDVLLCVVGGGC